MKTLLSAQIDTPLGQMIVIGDSQVIYLLESVDRRNLKRQISHLTERLQVRIISGQSKPIRMIEKELHYYFQGELSEFHTSFFLLGSPFQNRVWESLRKIPLGQTQSYSELAQTIEKPSAFRAVAGANGRNKLCIVIPCHRVINLNGELGGYSAGLARKKWLLEHEKSRF